MFALLGLSSVVLDRGEITAAEPLLEEARALIVQDDDQRMRGPWHLAQARLYRVSGKTQQARAELVAALDIITRLGLRRELVAVQADLASLTREEGAK